ncbi:MAG: hypothetical protein OFPI_21820 [Osedax symbiont Rs2]|nr:MAG: hypothetical protein OFPI_21820 [Osedax symbiont Rs2]
MYFLFICSVYRNIYLPQQLLRMWRILIRLLSQKRSICSNIAASSEATVSSLLKCLQLQ